MRDAIDRKERLMGFGHRVYRAYDPRAAALREVAEGMEHRPEWLELAIAVEDVALRVLAEKYPDRPLMTNVEYYAAPVLMGVGLTPDLFPATFALARHAGWTAHAIEQGANNRLIRPDVRYIGYPERHLPWHRDATGSGAWSGSDATPPSSHRRTARQVSPGQSSVGARRPPGG